MTFDDWSTLARKVEAILLDGSARLDVKHELVDEAEDCPSGFLSVSFDRAEYHTFTIRASRKRLERPMAALLCDTVHEHLHILLYPYTRLAASCAVGIHDCLDSEMSAREEEVVERIAQAITPLVAARLLDREREKKKDGRRKRS